MALKTREKNNYLNNYLKWISFIIHTFYFGNFLISFFFFWIRNFRERLLRCNIKIELNIKFETFYEIWLLKKEIESLIFIPYVSLSQFYCKEEMFSSINIKQFNFNENLCFIVPKIFLFDWIWIFLLILIMKIFSCAIK